MIRLDMSKNKTSTSVSMSTTNIFLYPWIVKQIFAGLLFTKLKWENRENDITVLKIWIVAVIVHATLFCKKFCPWYPCHIFAKNPVHDISVTFLQKILSMTSVSYFCKKPCPWHQCHIFAKKTCPWYQCHIIAKTENAFLR